MWHQATSLPQMDEWILLVVWLNLCFLRPTWVHNSNSKSIGSAVFAQLMAESPYTLQWAPLPAKLLIPMGVSGPHLIHDYLVPLKPTTRTAFQSTQPLLHRWLQSAALFSCHNCPFPYKDVDPIKLICFLGPTEPQPKSWHLDRLAIFAGLATVIDRQTMLLGL